MFSDGAIPNALNLITGYKDSFDTHGQLQRKLDRKTFLDDAFKFERLLKCDNSCDGVFEKNVLEKAIQVEIDLRRNERILDTSFCNKCPKPDCFPDRNIVKQCDVRCDQCGTAYYESKELNEKKSELTQTNKWASTQDFDRTVSFLFGNKTTPGQVCAYSKALFEKKVTDISGFCCLDAPYESVDWGEKVGLCHLNNITFFLSCLTGCRFCL